MRLKILINSEKGIFIPYNYQYQVQSAIYDLIRKSSEAYSTFLHDGGFTKSGKTLKLFTFSRLSFKEYKRDRQGFRDVKDMVLYFSTSVEKSFEHIVLGIFSDQEFVLNFREKYRLQINQVETLADPGFREEMKFSCLSPVTVSVTDERGKHYLDYMKPAERELFTESIRKNLLRKYYELNEKEFKEKEDFSFSFDPEYIARKQGRISKLISFKDNLKIKAMEAPFKIKADIELIRTGYDCGFGELNSAGFGMIKVI